MAHCGAKTDRRQVMMLQKTLSGVKFSGLRETSLNTRVNSKQPIKTAGVEFFAE